MRTRERTLHDPLLTFRIWHMPCVKSQLADKAAQRTAKPKPTTVRHRERPLHHASQTELRSQTAKSNTIKRARQGDHKREPECAMRNISWAQVDSEAYSPSAH